MYKLVFRNYDGDEIQHRVNVSFDDIQPTIPEHLHNWSEIPEYPLQMILINDTEIEDLSKFISGFHYMILPVGNWTLLSSLVKEAYNNSPSFDVDDHDEDYWGYDYRWDPENLSCTYSHSFSYHKDKGLLNVASFWVHDREKGGNALWSVHFQRDYSYASPLPAVYTIYTMISISSLLIILLWIRRTRRL